MAAYTNEVKPLHQDVTTITATTATIPNALGYILGNPSGAATWTLPALVAATGSIVSGSMLQIRNASSSVIALVAAGSDTIDGAGSINISPNFTCELVPGISGTSAGTWTQQLNTPTTSSVFASAQLQVYGLANTEYTVTIALGAPVTFNHQVLAVGVAGSVTGPASNPGNDTFTVAAAGTYAFSWKVPITTAGQLALYVNSLGSPAVFTLVPQGVYGVAAAGSVTGSCALVMVAGTAVRLQNPAGNASALTVSGTPGGTVAGSTQFTASRIA